MKSYKEIANLHDDFQFLFQDKALDVESAVIVRYQPFKGFISAIKISGKIKVAVEGTPVCKEGKRILQAKSNQDKPEGKMTREIRNQTVWNEFKTSHPTFFSINIISLNIPRHPKVCYLTLLSFTNENISGRQVTVDYLKEKLYLGYIAINEIA